MEHPHDVVTLQRDFCRSLGHERLVTHVRKGFSPKQSERSLEVAAAGDQIGGGDDPFLGAETTELDRVDLSGVHVEPVPGGLEHDSDSRLLESLAQPRDEDLQRLGRVERRCVIPQALDQTVGTQPARTRNRRPTSVQEP